MFGVDQDEKVCAVCNSVVDAFTHSFAARLERNKKAWRASNDDVTSN